MSRWSLVALTVLFACDPGESGSACLDADVECIGGVCVIGADGEPTCAALPEACAAFDCSQEDQACDDALDALCPAGVAGAAACVTVTSGDAVVADHVQITCE